MKTKKKNQRTTSNFYDHCDLDNWRFRTVWFTESLICTNVTAYVDKAQNCYCRKVKNVKGTIIDDKFYPDLNPIVNYPQIVNKMWYENN